MFLWENPSNALQELPKLHLLPPSAAANKVPKRPGIRSYDRVETLPGIDHFENKEKLESECLRPLLTWAKAVIPSKHLEATPLFMFATGGVRKMSKEAQDELISNIVSILENSGFRYGWCNTGFSYIDNSTK